MLQNAVPFVFNWGWILLVDTLHINRVIFAEMLTLTSTTGMLVASRLIHHFYTFSRYNAISYDQFVV